MDGRAQWARPWPDRRARRSGCGYRAACAVPAESPAMRACVSGGRMASAPLGRLPGERDERAQERPDLRRCGRRHRRRQRHGRERSSRWCGQPAGRAPTARSAASAACSTSRRRASPIRSSSPPTTASAPSSRSPSRPACTTRSASTSSPCASTTWSCRAPSRCSSSTISPPAGSIRSRARRSSPASPRAAGRPAAP